MDIYAQHGWGKSDRIQTALRAKHLSGVVLSPRDEAPDRMLAFSAALRDEFADEITILFDPQFYVTTVSPARDGYLRAYSYYEPDLTRRSFIDQADIRRYVESTLTYEATLPLDRLIAPTVRLSDFRDPWSQIALSMAQEAVTIHGQLDNAPPLIVSLVLDESALRNREALEEFLDVVTALEVTGVYLVVRCNDANYPALFEENALCNLLYLVYVLAAVNGFEVVAGYSDLVGLLIHAVGAKATATGWSTGLRQFTLARFEPSTGGGQARPRYTSAPLLNSILVVPELETTYQVNRVANVLSATPYDRVMTTGNPANQPWPPQAASLHHWQVLGQLASRISSQDSMANRLATLEWFVRGAIASYRALEQAGVPFEPASGPRNLPLWLRAIRSFRTDVGI